MNEVTVEEVVDAFSKSKNINSALKNLLKREDNLPDSLARLAKNFRATLSGIAMSGASKLFIKNHYKNNEHFFLVASRYAHLEFFDNLLGLIVDEFGEEFNSTYKSNNDSIEITDKKSFDRIVQQVGTKTEAAIQNANLPNSPFMKLTFYNSLFDPLVLKEVVKV